MPQQFKDEDMMANFNSKLKTNKFVKFDKKNNAKFTIIHSQCEVCYSVQGFKAKNQDKVNSELEDIIKALFKNETRDNVGKTLLTKFKMDIGNLMG